MGDLSLAYDALDRLALHGDTPNQPFAKEDSSWVRVPITQVPLATNIYIQTWWVWHVPRVVAMLALDSKYEVISLCP
jgi:hypothetical protein